jgi:hypothetical protein
MDPAGESVLIGTTRRASSGSLLAASSATPTAKIGTHVSKNLL